MVHDEIIKQCGNTMHTSVASRGWPNDENIRGCLVIIRIGGLKSQKIETAHESRQERVTDALRSREGQVEVKLRLSQQSYDSLRVIVCALVEANWPDRKIPGRLPNTTLTEMLIDRGTATRTRQRPSNSASWTVGRTERTPKCQLHWDLPQVIIRMPWRSCQNRSKRLFLARKSRGDDKTPCLWLGPESEPKIKRQHSAASGLERLLLGAKVRGSTLRAPAC
ncbi:hypothetical protein BDV11DRAFT_30867 [Aspergillus similis]